MGELNALYQSASYMYCLQTMYHVMEHVPGSLMIYVQRIWRESSTFFQDGFREKESSLS